MTIRQSPELLSDLIRDYIQANIDQALSDMSTDRDDAHIQLPPPVKYYVSEHYDPMETPAVFIRTDRIDLQKEQMGANFFDSKASINISIVVEDTLEETLTRGVWRYSAALQSILDQVELTSDNNKVKLVIVVKSMDYTPVYQKKTDTGGMSAAFRKEAILNCEVYHFENL